MAVTATFVCKICGEPLTLTFGQARVTDTSDEGVREVVVGLLDDQLKEHALVHEALADA